MRSAVCPLYMPNSEIRKCPWLQFLHRMALQLSHNSVSLQSPVFTSSRSNNDLGRKGQFYCLIVHVCLQGSNRKDSDLV